METAPVVQAVIAEEQREMVMHFLSEIVNAEVASVVDLAQMRSAADGWSVGHDGVQTLAATERTQPTNWRSIYSSAAES